MKNYWKWILGIVIVLVVLFGLGIGAHLLMAKFLPAARLGVDEFQAPMFGGRHFDNFGGMRSFHGMPHFGGGFMMLGRLLPLLLVGLLAYGAYRLGMRKTPAVIAPPAPVAEAPLRTCTRCGHQIQDGWNNCPNCGKKTG